MKIEQSYLVERRALGILGMSLSPLLLLVGFLFGRDNPLFWYMSISATFYANTQSLFTGVMFAVSIFLLSYRGYDLSDRLINCISGISGLILTCFPTNLLTSDLYYVGLFQCPAPVSNIIHLVSAAIFFLSLSSNIYINFRKGHSTEKKEQRNLLYTICALAILVCVLLIALFVYLQVWSFSSMVFESIALFFFGLAWLVKGQAIQKLQD